MINKKPVEKTPITFEIKLSTILYKIVSDKKIEVTEKYINKFKK